MSERKNNIAGFIFFIIFVVVILIWGASKNIQPDLRDNTGDGGYEPYKTFGHPLWN